MSASIDRYLTKRADLNSRKLVSGPLDGIDQVVVIPVLAERANIEGTLDSLAENAPNTLDKTLVIVVVNNRSAENVAPEAIKDNRLTLSHLNRLVRDNATEPAVRLRLAYIDAATPGHELSPKEGVGDARKIGLDWGLSVLQKAEADIGLLTNLDADTHVEPNYLEAIRQHFDTGTEWGAVIDFAHRIEGSIETQTAIIAYELFLRYHVLGLRYAGSPYAFHTIGSTIVTTTEAYATSGGMKRRQAGEDFYFLQELAKTGQVSNIRTTTVHPSPRPSWRVPFGTGKRIQRFLDASHDEYRIYHPDSYEVLRAWLRIVATHPSDNADSLTHAAHDITPELATFLNAQDFASVWPELQEHAPSPKALLRQFHRWFDAFKTLKLMHHLRDNGLPEQDTFDAIEALLTRYGERPIEPTAIRDEHAQHLPLLQRLAELERLDHLPTTSPPA